MLSSLQEPFGRIFFIVLGSAAVEAHSAKLILCVRIILQRGPDEQIPFPLFEPLLRLRISMISRNRVPPCCLLIILPDTLPFLIHHAKAVLCVRIALACRLPVPSEGKGIVLADALSLLIYPAKPVLGIRISLDCRLSVPSEGRSIVLPDALSLLIHQAKSVLCGSIPTLRSTLDPLVRSTMILADSVFAEMLPGSHTLLRCVRCSCRSVCGIMCCHARNIQSLLFRSLPGSGQMAALCLIMGCTFCFP